VRGFLVAALVLIGLDVALSAPSSRITALFALPGGWLAEWMDPGRPLITDHRAASSATSSTSSTSSAASTIGRGELISGLTNPLLAPEIIAAELGHSLAKSHR